MSGPIQEQVTAALTAPSPDSLWQLRGHLLEAGLPPDRPLLAVLDHFYRFLNELMASSTSRQYSHFASILDIGAVGGVAVQNLLDHDRGSEWWQRLLAGGLSEGLMVMAARQYVKAWEEEMKASFSMAAWYLYEQYWRISAEWQPDLPPKDRRRLIEQLLAPLQSPDASATVKAALLGRLFQLLILMHLAQDMGVVNAD